MNQGSFYLSSTRKPGSGREREKLAKSILPGLNKAGRGTGVGGFTAKCVDFIVATHASQYVIILRGDTIQGSSAK